ncbi:hypothetical protein GCM10012280_41790 [Wenjunlia tyrosinilytica]|uniref:SCO6045-like C-terminal domain-containing protein n=1 Tax=Wenjunlia tyrosinilytica TaxID=1544741 RepID=A0A917ZSX5_9ACTN|nr:hypothetical protein GCM10012280_41790 [Wenjunlia tyrosinilytica]
MNVSASAPAGAPTANTAPAAGSAHSSAAASGTDAARQRLALAQAALLSALVAGTPVPQGFDPARVRLQTRALADKRASVTAKVAPELPRILGDGFRPSFIRYAQVNPSAGGARRDALSFARARLRAAESSGDPAGDLTRQQRCELTAWVRERTGPAPRPRGRLRRLAAAARARASVLG